MTQRIRMAVQDHLKALPLLPSPMMDDAAYPSTSYAPAQVTLRPPTCPTRHVIDGTFVRMVHGAK